MAATMQPEAVMPTANGVNGTSGHKRWKYLILSRPGAFTSEDFEPGETPIRTISEMAKILVIGAG